MSTFNIIMATRAGAFCNAMNVVRQSECRATEQQEPISEMARKTGCHSTIWNSIRTIQRTITRLYSNTNIDRIAAKNG